MKVLLVLAAICALCTSTAIPLVPGDNSHYVEGVSRYIWMPDGHGVPILVDLQEPVDEGIKQFMRNGADNSYWLYTRSNRNSPQRIVNGNASTIWNSNYNAQKQLKVIVHGWRNDISSEVNEFVKNAFLDAGDVNVIVVDWSRLAGNLNYLTSARGVPDVGQHVGQFVNWLISTTGGSLTNVHLVGHSLGAHIVGNAGRTLNGRVARVTGLDPAGPTWGNNRNAMTKSDAIYVEAIHTDGGLLGIFDKIADADFYPNGGRNPQPGCAISTCSHGRAYELFAATVIHNHLEGQACESTDQAENGLCTGAALQMGNNILNKFGSGIFYVQTGRSWPF